MHFSILKAGRAWTKVLEALTDGNGDFPVTIRSKQVWRSWFGSLRRFGSATSPRGLRLSESFELMIY